jgi:gliding motility-associated-like protein
MVTVNEPTPLTHTITSTDVLCFGDATGTITIIGSGGVGGYWYELYNPYQVDSNGQFTGLSAGTYTGVVIDANGCRDTTAVDTIFQPTQIVLSAPTIQNIDCFGDSTGSIGIGATDGTGAKTLTLAGPVNDPIGQPSPANFQNLPAGIYIITATDANACTVTTLVTLTQNPELFFSSITNTEETCFGDSTAVISFQGAGGVSPYTYVFGGVLPASTQTTYSGLTTGTYNIELIDDLGCRADTNYTLDGPEEINFSEFEITPTTCLDTEDGKLNVTARGGRGGRYTYSLEPGFIVNTNGAFRDLAPRTYVLRTSDTAGCFIDTTVVIPLPSNPMVVTLTKDDLGCHGIGNEGRARAEVGGGTPPYTYLWSSTPAQTSSEAVGLYQGLYTVDVVDGNGCLVRDTLVIEPGPCCQEVFLPNAFSPNGDGRNDEFRALSTAGIELEQFEVYNRWGIRVWQTNNMRSGWNGEYDGERAATGTFYYVFRYRCLTDGQTYTMKGDVVLVR